MTAESKDWTLSASQQSVVQLVREGKSVFFTGPAGCGKSYLLKYLITLFNHRNDVAITATTGIAAFAIGGTTLHSFAGLKAFTPDVDVYCETVKPAVARRWRETNVLFIDEVSMLDWMLFDALDGIARKLRSDERPWGGMQVVLTGDFLQLPPVSHTLAGPFAFKASAWKALVEDRCITLEGNFRQTDGAFLQALNQLRFGRCDSNTLRLFEACVLRKFDPTDLIQPTIVCPRRAEADRINATALRRLPQSEHVYIATDWGPPKAQLQLDFQCRVGKRVALRKGAQVLLVKNLDPALGLVNGAQGIVESFMQLDTLEVPIVRFANGQQLPIDQADFEIYEGRKLVARRRQIPLLLAWAVTIHKCQGMSLDRIKVRTADAFEYGQIYVALSRARSLEGLWLETPLNPRLVRAHPDAVAFHTPAQPLLNKSSTQ